MPRPGIVAPNPSLWRRPHIVVYVVIHAALFVIGVLLTFLDIWEWKAIGASLVATGAVGSFILIYVLMVERTNDRIRVLSELGLVDAFPVRSARIKPEYDRRVESAREHIDIMGFGLRTLRQDYANDFIRWQARAPVRILLLDPEFSTPKWSYASQRDQEEENEIGTIQQDVETFEQSAKRFDKSLGAGNAAFSLRRPPPCLS